MVRVEPAAATSRAQAARPPRIGMLRAVHSGKGVRLEFPGVAASPQMDDVTQQNASLVEETPAAACSMDAQARTLRDAVAAFSLADAPASS